MSSSLEWQAAAVPVTALRPRVFTVPREMFWVWEVMEREGLQGQEGAGRGREALAQTPAAWVYLTLAIALSLKGTLARSPSYVLGGFCLSVASFGDRSVQMSTS